MQIKQRIIRFFQREDGASALEYVLMAAMVAVFIATFSSTLQGAIKGVFDAIIGAMGTGST